jgi:hypothetical protein
VELKALLGMQNLVLILLAKIEMLTGAPRSAILQDIALLCQPPDAQPPAP